MKRKFLAWLMTFAMVFNMAMPYTAFADDLFVDTDSSYSADENGATNNDDDATDVGGEPTVGEPAGDGAQGDTQGDEAQGDEPATGADDNTESDGKEDTTVGGDEPVGDDEPVGGDEPVGNDEPVGGDEPVGNDEPVGGDEPVGDEEPVGNDAPVGDEEPVGNDEPVGDNVGNLLGDFANQAVADGLMPIADDPMGPLATKLVIQDVWDGDFIKLYTYNDGVKGTTNLLDGVPLEQLTSRLDCYYTLDNIDPGVYWAERYRKDLYESDPLYTGGISFVVEEGVTNTYSFGVATSIAPINSGWKENVDFTFTAEVIAKNHYERVFELGRYHMAGAAYHDVRTSFLYVRGDTINVTFTPIGEKAETYKKPAKQTENTTKDSITTYFNKTRMLQGYEIKVTAPTGSTISAGNLDRYYSFNFSDPIDPKDDGTTASASFDVDFAVGYIYQGSNMHFVRVQHPDGITYWTFGTWNQNGYTVNVTKDDLKIGNKKFNKSTVIDDFSENIYDVGNIYMNINAAGYLNMKKGDGYELNMHRNWQAVDTYWPTSIALPDMHYKVVDFNGNPSDVVEITPDEYNNSQAMMRAKNNGTALVLVTYDTVTHPNSMAKDDNESVVFSATWPELTGVFVVSVGEDGTGIETNMTLNRYRTAEGANPRGPELDAEHDIIFYLGKDGAEYSFTPEEGTTVSVARSTVANGAMSFNGFTTEGVAVDSDTGKVTVSGMKTGRHIIKVEKDGVANYQVITTRETTMKITHKNGQEVTTSNPAAAGEKITIQFTNLLNPMERLAGIYNCTPDIYMVDADGNAYHNNKQVLGGTYDFPYSTNQQALKLTVPYDYASDELVLTAGTIKLVGFKDAPGGHRAYRYGDVESAGLSDDANTEAAVLPGVTIPVTPAEYLDGKIIFKKAGTEVPRTDLVIKLYDDKDKVVTVNDDGTFNAVAGAYNYEVKGAGITYTTGTLTLSKKATEFTINLQEGNANAWDGTTLSKPKYDGQTDEPDDTDTIDKTKTYLINNGNELAWVSNWLSAGYNNRNDTNTGIIIKLTADIDLANYPWNSVVPTAINRRTLEVQGEGHKITGLNATNGLFAAVASAKIYNLTVAGEVNATTGNVAGFVGQTGSATIENCCNEVAVNSGGNNVGGFIAYNGGTVTIKNCVNKANISGVKYVGGIMGYNNYGYTIHGCYNTGKISGTAAGGIAGSATSKNSSWNMASIDNCYSVGYAEHGIVGEKSAQYTQITNCAYLKTSGVTDEAGIAMSADDLKNFAPNGTMLKATCGGGYPALSWETGVKFHDPVEGDVVAPTCTEMGYTKTTCSECKAEYKTNYVAALGHEWDEHAASDECTSENVKCVVTPSTCTKAGTIVRTCLHAGCTDTITEDLALAPHTKGDKVSDHLTYTLYKCSVCDQPVYKEYTNNLYSVMDISDNNISSLSVNDSKWVYNADKERIECVHGSSTDGSDTTFTLNFTIDHSGIIYLEYGLERQGVDDGIFTLAKSGATDKLNDVTYQATNSGSYQAKLEAGTYTLTGKLDWYASREVSGFFGPTTANGNDADTAYIKNVMLLAYDSDDKADAEMAKVSAVEKKIAEIETVSSTDVTDLSKKPIVTEARSAYDKLDANLQKLVTNYSKLTAAEANIKKLEALDEENKKNPEGAVPAGKIRVTFRLIGSTLTTDDVGVDYDEDGWPDGAHGAQYQTWIKTTSYTVDKDSMVADVFRQALDDSGLNYSLSSSSYINSISAPDIYGGYALKDRTNGDRSGWMYSVNGIHVQKMMGAQELKNGDKIIVHYINDYYWEDSQWYGGSPYGSSKTWDTWLNAKDVDPNAADAVSGGGGAAATEKVVVSTVIEPVVSVDANGEAKATLTTNDIKGAITEAKAAGADEIVVAPKISDEASKVTVSIPALSAKSVGKDADADLRVKSDIADIKIDKDDLTKLGASGNVVVSAEKNADGTIDVSITANGKDMQLSNATISVAAPGAGNNTVLVIVKADGTEEVIKNCVVADGVVTANISGSCTVKVVTVDTAFADTQNHWGKAAAEFVAARGIFNGVGDKQFAPNDKMNRAMVATVLYRLQNEPAVSGKLTFKDSIDDWAKNAVIWAAEQGIVSGDENSNYNGSAAVTRQELAAMLYRFAKAVGLNSTASAGLSSFSDSADVADWATDAMRWAVGCGLIKGDENGALNPNGTATRAEVATVIMRLIEMSVK